MASKTAPMPAVFGAAKPKSDPKPKPAEGYDQWVPLRMADASDSKLRCLITWADYCYWVKDKPIMHDHTFDMLVREYERRNPDDRSFLDSIGMWAKSPVDEDT